MKTPEEWLALRAETLHNGFDAGLYEWISKIQLESFQEGWKRGMEDSVDMQSKGINPNRAIDAWR